MIDLKKRRQELGLTLEQVGQEVGVGRSLVRKWEVGAVENMKRTYILRYAQALKIDPMEIVDPNHELDKNSSKDIISIYNQLNKSRQDKTYNFAQTQLEEQQNKIVRPAFTKVELQQGQYINLYGVTSAGIGEDMVEEHMEKIHYNGYVPEDYDYALKVNGDSMEPLFDNGEIIFVNKKINARSGQIIIADLNGDSYVKKLKQYDDKFYLVSLNKKYDSIEIKDYDDFRVDGVVIL